MSRQVIMTGIKPAEVKTKSGDSILVCRCGLTDKADGTCSGNHRKFQVASEDPKITYQYDKKGKRQEVLDECCSDQCCAEEKETDSDQCCCCDKG